MFDDNHLIGAVPNQVGTRRPTGFGANLDMLLPPQRQKSANTGVWTGMCVFHTLMSGFMRDYYNTLIENCAATTYGPDAHMKSLA